MVSRRSLLSNLGVLALTGGGLWLLRDRIILPRPKVEAIAGATSSGWIDLPAGRQQLLTIDVLLNGEPARVLVDSGAQISVVDRALAERLDESTVSVPVVAMGVAGGPQLGRTIKVDVELGRLSLTGLGAAVLDLAHVAALGEGRFSAILGDNALRTVIADIDFPRRRISFHLPQTYALPAGAVAVPVRTADRRLMVPVRLGGVQMEVALDTGASPTLALTRERATELGLLDGRPLKRAPSISLAGISSSTGFLVDELQFGGETYRQVDVQIFDGGPGALLPDGLLGLGALRRFRVILDRGGGRLHLVRPAGREQPRTGAVRSDAEE